MKWIPRLIVLVLLSLLLGSAMLRVTIVNAEEQTIDQGGDEATVSGLVTNASFGYGLEDVHVTLVDPDDPDVRIHVATTDNLGHYNFTRTISDTWYIRFEWQPAFEYPYGYLPQYYNNVTDITQATPVNIEVGSELTDINATLIRKGQITGRVTAEADGAPIANVSVSAFKLPDTTYSSDHTLTDNHGVYTMTLEPGYPYKMRYDPLNTSPFALEYYGDALTYEDAQTFRPPDDRVARLDVALAIGGKITGTITSSWLNKPIQFPTVFVQNEQGERVQQGYPTLNDPAYPNSPGGHYVVTNLPVGNYQIYAEASAHRPHLRAGIVRVEADTTTRDIDVRLVLTPQVVSIVTAPAIPDTFLIIMSHDPQPLITTNGGLNWQILSSKVWASDAFFAYPDSQGHFGFVAGITPRGAPGEGTRIFVGSPKYGFEPAPFNPGIFRSGDNGQSWAESPVDPSLVDSQCFAGDYISPVVSPATPNEVYMLFRCQAPSGGSAHVLVSTNNAVTWNDVTTVDERTLVLSYDARLILSPHNAGELYAYDGYSKWYKSTDRGLNWQSINFPLQTFVFDAVNPNFLTGTTSIRNAPYTRMGKRSIDGGATWQDWVQQPCSSTFIYEPPQLLAHPTEPNVIFLRCDNLESPGLYRSDSQGDYWKRLTEEAGQMIAIDYGIPGSRPARLLWARVDGLWASPDMGESWEMVLANYQTNSQTNSRPLYLPSVIRNP